MSEENVDATGGVRHRISLPSERAAQRRTLDERLFVRFPVLYSWIAGAVTRLPPEHRLRRFMLARSASRSLAAVNRRDFAVLFLALDPEIEYLPAGDQRPPGMDPVSHGHDGYESVWRQMIDSFEDFRAKPEELFDLGDVMLATVRYTGHGSGSGVPVDVPLAQLFRLRKGMIVWQQDFSDRAKAFEAVGLSE